MRYVILISLLFLIGCSAPTPEEIWASKLQHRCYAMGGNAAYIDHIFECYRHPIGRMTKTLFKEYFNDNTSH